MMPPMPAHALVALQRVLHVALLAPVVLIAATAAIPAFALLPFLPGGTDRAVKLISAHTAYARTLLGASRPDSPARRLDQPISPAHRRNQHHAAPLTPTAQRSLHPGQHHRLGQRTDPHR